MFHLFLSLSGGSSPGELSLGGPSVPGLNAGHANCIHGVLINHNSVLNNDTMTKIS